jgi:hypothetical protein
MTVEATVTPINNDAGNMARLNSRNCDKSGTLCHHDIGDIA